MIRKTIVWFGIIELDAFTVVIKHDTVETNINMFNNVIWPLTQNILKITGVMSLKFGTPHCLQGTPFLRTHGVPGTRLQNASPQIEPCLGNIRMFTSQKIGRTVFVSLYFDKIFYYANAMDGMYVNAHKKWPSHKFLVCTSLLFNKNIPQVAARATRLQWLKIEQKHCMTSSTWFRGCRTKWVMGHRTWSIIGHSAIHSDTWIFINWIWIATRFRDRQIWGTASGNSAILAPKSRDQENREKTPLFETKAAISFLMPQGALCL